MSFPDYEIIETLLRAAASVYPLAHCLEHGIDQQLLRHIEYLSGHGFIVNETAYPIDEPYLPAFVIYTVTVRGLDYLAADGGLTAQLSPVTIRFQPEDLVQLISLRVNASDLPPDEKATINSSLKSLPAEALKHLSIRLVDLAVDNLPAAFRLLHTSLGL